MVTMAQIERRNRYVMTVEAAQAEYREAREAYRESIKAENAFYAEHAAEIEEMDDETLAQFTTRLEVNLQIGAKLHRERVALVALVDACLAMCKHDHGRKYAAARPLLEMVRERVPSLGGEMRERLVTLCLSLNAGGR